MKAPVAMLAVAAVVMVVLHTFASQGNEGTRASVASAFGQSKGSIHEQLVFKDDSKLAKQLAADARADVDEPATRFNATLCAIVTNEQAFIDEWIAYHTLIGIQQFYLYDFEASKSLEDKLLPYIEAGIVKLHTMTYKDGRPSDNFHGKMLHHCSTVWAKHTNWLFQIDVDEYLLMSHIYGYRDRPYVATSTSRVHYPLHDYLLSDRLRGVRCMPVTRDGTFRNVGIHEFKPFESLLETQQWREAYRFLKHAGKVVLRASERGLLSSFLGAHSCSVDPKAPHVDGIIDANRDPIRDSQGVINKEGGDPGIPEPIRIAHFQERSLGDCIEKLDHIKDKNNWRFLNGGKEMCYRNYVASQDDLESGAFDGHRYEKMAKAMLDHVVVKDDSLGRSWPGQRAIEYMAYLRRWGPRRIKTRDEDELRGQVDHIYYD